MVVFLIAGGFLTWGAWAAIKKHLWLPTNGPPPWWQKLILIITLIGIFFCGSEIIGPQLIIALADGFSSACDDPEEFLELQQKDFVNIVSRNFFCRAIGIFFRIPDQDGDGLVDPVEIDYGSCPKKRTMLKMVSGSSTNKGRTIPIKP